MKRRRQAAGSVALIVAGILVSVLAACGEAGASGSSDGPPGGFSSAGAAGGRTPQPGSTYIARNGPANGSEQLFKLHVSSNARVVSIPAAQLGVTCVHNHLEDLFADTHSGRAQIGPDKRFVLDLRVLAGSTKGGARRLRLTGRFVAGGKVSGSILWSAVGCTVDTAWRATVVPRYQRWAGTTSASTTVTFQRTIETSPHVQAFSFGTLKATCPGGSHEAKTVSVDAYASVAGGRFSSEGEDTESEDARIAGRFTSAMQAHGTVSVVGRDDCAVTGVTWTAHLVGTGP
jgi:hypothetical protein